MKKNRIITMSLREIKKSRKRFFSLCVLSIIGVSFYVGMKISGPTMLESLDKYYDDNKMYDLKIVSTLGFVDEDIEAIKKINNKYTVLGSHTKDVIINDGEHEAVLRMHEINKGMNNISIIKGRMPKKYNEIVVEDGIIDKTDYKIGDTLKFELEADDTSLKTKELKIVGIVRSPEYLTNNQASQSRGNSSLGSGQVAYYSYVLKELFNLDYYTEIYVQDKDAIKYTTTKEEYLKEIKNDIKQINIIKKERQNKRYNKVINEANKKLKEEIEKANIEINNAQKNLEQYKNELDNGKIELENAKRKLDNVRIELVNAKKVLDNANNEIQKGQQLLNESKEELERGKQKLNDGKKEIEDKLKEIKDYNITYDKLAQFVKKYDSSSFSINDIVKIFSDDEIDIKETIESSLINIKIIAYTYGINLEAMFQQYGIDVDALLEKPDIKINEIIKATTLNQLKKLIIDENFIILVKESIPQDFPYRNQVRNYLEEYLNNKDDIVKLFTGIRDIENGYIEYNNNLQLINENEIELNKSYKQYENGMINYNLGIREYNSGIREYNIGLNEYTLNSDLYNKGVEEVEANKKEVEEKIFVAKEKINKIDKQFWFTQTREDNNEYITYISSYDSVEKLSNLFPVIFFLVSIIISLLSMARMAIENRSEIGTLKALGFSKNEVRVKFVIYALLATLIGGIIGITVGYTVFPNAIISVFEIIHTIPIRVYSTDIMPIITGLLLSTICIVGSTSITINNLTKEKTTSLLRPIAPPIGKKIILEKIPFIWDRINYSNKLTIRNIFRFKRRILMSIFGIASCTMILLAGYGIKDSIAYVVDKQYNEINHNDALITFHNKQTPEELEQDIDNEQLEFNVYAKIDQVKVENKRLSLIIPDNKKEFKKTLTITDVETKKEVDLKENSVIVTEKLAKYFNKKVGDTIKIFENNNLTYEYKISNICENYIGDYIYMPKETYKKTIGEYDINTQYLKFKDLSKENEIISNMKDKNPHIINAISITNAKKEADTLFKSLNIIVYVLIIFSGALSFVVFYSLAYINISERQREIATLKVLGFYNNEIDNYIMKEELIITIIGILVGLVLGTIYTYQLVDSIQINTMQYIKGIHLDSYIQTSVFMIIFTMIVSIGVHFALKKIDLIESLKSVE